MGRGGGGLRGHRGEDETTTSVKVERWRNGDEGSDVVRPLEQQHIPALSTTHPIVRKIQVLTYQTSTISLGLFYKRTN